MLCLDAANDQYIILCNFSGHVMSGFEVIEGIPVAWSL